jgi:hypothetical protein
VRGSSAEAPGETLVDLALGAEVLGESFVGGEGVLRVCGSGGCCLYGFVFVSLKGKGYLCVGREMVYLRFLAAVRNHRVVPRLVRVQWVEWLPGKR